MLKYILKRLLLLIPVVIGITLFIYVILSAAPGDPAQLILVRTQARRIWPHCVKNWD